MRFLTASAVIVVPLVGSMITAQTPARSERSVRPTVPEADRGQSDKVFLEHADILKYDRQLSFTVEERPQYQILVGNVRFRKGDMFMYCDSAHFYESINSFDAFGNVRMEQGDTLFVYADELNYNGEDELAVLYADAGKKVRLINRDVELKTDVFNYDLADERGFYEVGGELTDNTNKLVSWEGEYFPNTKYANFYTDVRLTGLNRQDTLRMYTDTLIYNTDSHVAELVSETLIVDKDGDIHSTSGTYNTNTGFADLYKRSLITTRRGNTLTGDTLFFDRDTGIGEAFGNMVFTDSARQSSIAGDYGYYNDGADSAFVTGRALAKEYSRGDTLYLHGDTINAYITLPDSTRITNVYHGVRFYRSDIQGLCDSLSMSEADSILYMYRHPVVWSDEKQVFGNVMHVHFNDSTADWARLPESGFLAEHIAEDCYNQLSGSDMTTWFNDSTISRLYVEGNVMMISFPMENDSTYNKYAYLETSFMDVYFESDTVREAHFWPQTTTKIVPLYLAKRKDYFLPKFSWFGDLRPTSPEDVFNVSQEMIDLVSSVEIKHPVRPAKNPTAPNPDAPAPAVPAPLPTEESENDDNVEEGEVPKESKDSNASEESDTSNNSGASSSNDDSDSSYTSQSPTSSAEDDPS